MVDAVLTSDHSPLACGTVKWSMLLAQKLGVPHDTAINGHKYQHPLYSVRLSEYPYPPKGSGFDVLVHDLSEDAGHWQHWVNRASCVYAANAQLAAAVSAYRLGTTTLWAPSSLQGNATRGNLDILTFGFAHKYQATHFERLKQVLDATPGTYTISLSTGIHEGRSWDQDFQNNMALMREIFGDKLRCLGFMADDGLARLLAYVNAVALFFDPGVRANNTSFWGAMEAGVPVITNLDAGSPPELQHEVNVFDVHQMQEWPDAQLCRDVRGGAAKVVQQYGWERLIATLKAPVHA